MKLGHGGRAYSDGRANDVYTQRVRHPTSRAMNVGAGDHRS